ncbi:MAG TPA: hypothetical protein VKR06_24370, partial [Ktedonosporobacter sp.]|nr:hypothetical protein [Ktedonosporobacter sp.]
SGKSIALVAVSLSACEIRVFYRLYILTGTCRDAMNRVRPRVSVDRVENGRDSSRWHHRSPSQPVWRRLIE